MLRNFRSFLLNAPVLTGALLSLFSSRLPAQTQPFAAHLDTTPSGTFMVFPSRPFYSYLVQRSSDLTTWEDMDDGRFYGTGQDLRYLVTDAVKLPPTPPPGTPPGQPWTPPALPQETATFFVHTFSDPAHQDQSVLAALGGGYFEVLAPFGWPLHAVLANGTFTESDRIVTVSLQFMGTTAWPAAATCLTPDTLTAAQKRRYDAVANHYPQLLGGLLSTDQYSLPGDPPPTANSKFFRVVETESDVDGDGVSDLIEVADGTYRWVADTDGDGIKDGDEKALGLDPHANDAWKALDINGDGTVDDLERQLDPTPDEPVLISVETGYRIPCGTSQPVPIHYLHRGNEVRAAQRRNAHEYWSAWHGLGPLPGSGDGTGEENTGSLLRVMFPPNWSQSVTVPVFEHRSTDCSGASGPAPSEEPEAIFVFNHASGKNLSQKEYFSPSTSGDPAFWLAQAKPPMLEIWNGMAAADPVKEPVGVGAFTVANLNDTDADGTVDKDDDNVSVTPQVPNAPGVNEVDLMQLKIRGLPTGQMKLEITGGAIRVWQKSTKETEVALTANGPAKSLLIPASELPKTVWLEATQASSAVRDISLALSHIDSAGHVTSGLAQAKATAVWAVKGTLKFSGNQLWPDCGEPLKPEFLEHIQHFGKEMLESDGVFMPGRQDFMGAEFTVFPTGIETETAVKFDLTRQVSELRYMSRTSDPDHYHLSTYMGWKLKDGKPDQQIAFLGDSPNDDSQSDGDKKPDDEDATPANKHIYQVDTPGVPSGPWPPASTPPAKCIQQFNALEYVTVRFDGIRPSGKSLDASRCSPKVAWHSFFHVEVDTVQGKYVWKDLDANNNDRTSFGEGNKLFWKKD